MLNEIVGKRSLHLLIASFDYSEIRSQLGPKLARTIQSIQERNNSLRDLTNAQALINDIESCINIQLTKL